MKLDALPPELHAILVEYVEIVANPGSVVPSIEQFKTHALRECVRKSGPAFVAWHRDGRPLIAPKPKSKPAKSKVDG